MTVPGNWSGCRRLVGALAAWLIVVTSVTFMGGLLTADAAPGVPADPIVRYFENFENMTNGTSVGLSSYTGGPAAQNMTYTASAGYLRQDWCNGVVMDRLSSPPPP
jgi:hypothetical protein